MIKWQEQKLFDTEENSILCCPDRGPLLYRGSEDIDHVTRERRRIKKKKQKKQWVVLFYGWFAIDITITKYVFKQSVHAHLKFIPTCTATLKIKGVFCSIRCFPFLSFLSRSIWITSSIIYKKACEKQFTYAKRRIFIRRKKKITSDFPLE